MGNGLFRKQNLNIKTQQPDQEQSLHSPQRISTINE